MKILIIEHAPHENPGIILDWISENNFTAETVRPFKGEKLPGKNDFSFLIIMGGPQSADDYEKYPYMIDETNFVKKTVEENKYVLGICLGAQIMSTAFGSKVQKSPNSEFGFYPVEFTEEALSLKAFNGFPKILNCLHWHNDMPGINDKLKFLGKSEGCPVQGIIYNDKTIGLQFHMEIRRKDVEGLIEFDKEILNRKEKFIMPPEEIRSQDFELMNSYMKKFLNNFISNIYL